MPCSSPTCTRTTSTTRRAHCSATDLPIFCQPQDTERLHADGFIDVRPVHGDATLGDLLIARTDGRHGTGELGEAMAPVSGFVLHAPGEPSLYIAGDTILCDEVRARRRRAHAGRRSSSTPAPRGSTPATRS